MTVGSNDSEKPMVMKDYEPFSERVVKVPIPTHHYSFLTTKSGNMLGLDPDGAVRVFSQADDRVIWDVVDDTRFRHVATDQEVAFEPIGNGSGYTLDKSQTNEVDSSELPVQVEHGPEKLPSQYLDMLRQNGWVCLTNILSDETLQGLELVACTDRFADRSYDRSRPALSQHPAVARTAAEPVSLWLLREYMQLYDIRLGHSPAMAVLTQDDGQRDVQGWHSDYPYHWGVPADGVIPTATGQTVLGVQRNVCVSDFSKVRGATAFKLGSHARDVGPDDSWGTATKYAYRGSRAEHGLPYNGPEADIVEAPGGSIILYDSRTWHRAGVNRTDQKRAAMLQAMIPMYIMPKNDTSAAYKDFIESSVYEQITDRERLEIRNLMVHTFPGPGGRFAIGPDVGLTETIRDKKNDSASGGY